MHVRTETFSAARPPQRHAGYNLWNSAAEAICTVVRELPQTVLQGPPRLVGCVGDEPPMRLRTIGRDDFNHDVIILVCPGAGNHNRRYRRARAALAGALLARGID